MMKLPARGRLYQDSSFTFSECNGLKIKCAMVCKDADTGNLYNVYIKIEDYYWYNYFLDSGIGFLEELSELDTDDDAYHFIEITQEYQLQNQVIAQIYGKPDGYNTCVVIEFNDKSKLILKCKNPKIFDSGCELLRC